MRDTHVGQFLAGLYAITAFAVVSYAISQGAFVAAAAIGGGTAIGVGISAFLRSLPIRLSPTATSGSSAMLMDVHQRGNLRFPQSLPEFQRLFPDDAACAGYLEKARWSDGFVCPHCQAAGEPFRFANRPGVLRCRRCRRDNAAEFRFNRRRHRTDLRRALLRSLAAPYMLGVWVITG